MLFYYQSNFDGDGGYLFEITCGLTTGEIFDTCEEFNNYVIYVGY